MTLHDNIMVTGLEKSLLAWGADPSKPHDEGIDLGYQRSGQSPSALALEDRIERYASKLISGRQVRLFLGGRAGL